MKTTQRSLCLYIKLQNQCSIFIWQIFPFLCINIIWLLTKCYLCFHTKAQMQNLFCIFIFNEFSLLDINQIWSLTRDFDNIIFIWAQRCKLCKDNSASLFATNFDFSLSIKLDYQRELFMMIFLFANNFTF